MNIIKVVLMLLLREYTARCVPLNLRGDFNAQVQHLLSQEILSSDEVHQITLYFDNFQKKLQTRWEGADLFAYGSLFTGLGTKTSDIDFYLRIPNYNVTADAYIVEETAKLLYQQPDRYGSITPILDRRVPMVTYYDIDMQRNIDLSFRSDSGVENTKLVAYYLNIDERFVPLTAIIKFWCKVHHLTGKGLLPNYAVYLMVIFYLQQKNMSPSGQQVQVHLPRRLVGPWNTKFAEVPYNIKNDESLYELLGGFFKYYSNFNFTKDCVSGFVGRPVARSDLEDINRISEEFSLYKSYFKVDEYEPLALDTPICVQDIFVHNNNVAKRFSDDDALRFINNIKYVVKMYDELSSDKFLRHIVMNDASSEVVSVEENVEVSENVPTTHRWFEFNASRK